MTHFYLINQELNDVRLLVLLQGSTKYTVFHKVDEIMDSVTLCRSPNIRRSPGHLCAAQPYDAFALTHVMSLLSTLKQRGPLWQRPREHWAVLARVKPVGQGN